MFREVGGMIVHRIQEEESFRSLLTDESSSVASSTGDSSVSLAERTTSVSQTEYQRNNAGGCCYG